MRKVKKTVPKQKIKDFGAVFFVMIFFPYIIHLIFHGISPLEKEKIIANDTVVIVTTKIGYEKIPIEEYLVGALAASINTNYEEEALKAQAVLLRTAVIVERERNQPEDNKVYQETIRQPYFSTADMQEQYGEEFEDTYLQLKKIVEATENIILTYQKEPIETPFCACSSGNTRNGKEAFGDKDYPYLQSAVCESDVLSEDYIQDYSFGWKQLLELLEMQEVTISENTLSGNAVSENQSSSQENRIIIEKTDSAGYVVLLSVDGGKIAGEEFRKRLRLHSAHFILEEDEKGVTIQTKGLGHGVGMSQFAANHMAENGSGFIEILSYFFTDTEIEKN